MIRTYVSASSVFAREGLAAIVRGDARLFLAGEGRTGDLAHALIEIDPDVVLTRSETGVRRPDVPTVALVDDPRETWMHDAGRDESGGFAILSGDASPSEVVAAIVAVAAGLVAVQPRTIARYDEVPLLAPAVAERARQPVAETLTARERDVLIQLARGVANKTIASDLGISEHTVKFHVAAIFAKLGAASRTEAVAQGVRLGLIML